VASITLLSRVVQLPLFYFVLMMFLICSMCFVWQSSGWS